ncbi:putative ribonuclease H-like domain-containing protein, partial [Tanacetum coccineum]
MDVKSAFLYGKIDEEVYVSQPPGFIYPKYPKKVYKVVKALYGLHQAPRAWYATLSTFLLKSGYRRGTIDKTLFIKKEKNDIMLVQVYVDDIIFGSTKRSWCDEFETLMKSRFQMSSMGELTFFLGLQTASTPIVTQKPLVKDEEASDVDVHLYRSMIGSLMYLTASRPDIMFAVCACSRFQVTPKTSHLSAIKRIFRYLKGKPKLGLWYPKVSLFDLEAYSDSDYAGANLDRKSTTGGCQFLGRRLISWQCNKQIIVATYTTEAEYVAAANCHGQVLWIQNQMLDYGFNFMNTKIYIDNESTICIIKNLVIYSKTKHIAIRRHFIRDAYEKKLIQLSYSKLHSLCFMYITAKVTGKPVSISEASIRSDLLFNDADGIDSLPNQAIFDAIQLMGENIFSRNVTPLFDSMLVQPTEDESDTLERQSEPQPIPSPPHLSEAQVEPQSDPSSRPSPTAHISDSIPEGSGGNHGGQSSSDRSLSGNKCGMTLQSVYDLCISLYTQVTDQAKQIKHLKAQIKKLKKKAKPGRKSAKAEPTVHKDPAFDELDDDVIDNMETEDAQDMGRTRYMVHEEKEREEKEVSTKDALGTDKQKVSTDKEEVSTDKPDEGTDKQKVSTDKEEDSTDRPDEGTIDQTEGRSANPKIPTPTPTTFGDDETIAQVLINISQAKAVSRENEKGVELKDVENIERPRPTSTRSLLSLKPLPKIDPKDKGKKKIEEDESDTKSEDINETEKKFKMLAHDEEIARKMQEDWEAEEERKRLAEEEAANAALIQDFDDIKARIKANRLLALRLQEEEREQFTMEERVKFLHDTIAAQRRFLAEQRAAAIRNRPPTRTQLRSQMMTYLKHVGNKKHSDLKNKTFEEIQALYEKVKRFDESFTVVGSNKDERKTKEMNEEAKDPRQKRLKKRVAKETAKK